MASGKPFKNKTIRMHPYENEIIDSACAALNGVERSLLVQEAVHAEASRLGIRWSAESPPPLEVSWPYYPDRGEEATGVRVTITVSLPLAELVTRAAEHVHASEPHFIVGATLAYVGRLQKCFRGIHADTPEEAQKMRADLQRIKVPAKFQYRPSRKAK